MRPLVAIMITSVDEKTKKQLLYVWYKWFPVCYFNESSDVMGVTLSNTVPLRLISVTHPILMRRRTDCYSQHYKVCVTVALDVL